jgi:hypothetical protein
VRFLTDSNKIWEKRKRGETGVNALRKKKKKKAHNLELTKPMPRFFILLFLFIDMPNEAIFS